MSFQRTSYDQLNARQKENYNFQKVAGRLAEYGYNCLRLNDDWHGADFLAVHVNGSEVLRVQLKGRLSLDAKYRGRDLHVAFLRDDACYVYPHDDFLAAAARVGRVTETKSWKDSGNYTWPTVPQWALDFLQPYRV